MRLADACEWLQIVGAVLVLDGGAKHAEVFLPSLSSRAQQWFQLFAPQQPTPANADRDGGTFSWAQQLGESLDGESSGDEPSAILRGRGVA